MDARTLKALHGSIHKWIKIATWKGVDKGVDNCPLCFEFLHEGVIYCENCPVQIKTGKDLCFGSPYGNFVVSSDNEYGITDECANIVAGPKSQKAAEDMALFLIDLLPEEEKSRYYE